MENKHNKKHLVYSDGVTRMFDNNCSACHTSPKEEYQLAYCYFCNQMTNHLKENCQKCASPKEEVNTYLSHTKHEMYNPSPKVSEWEEAKSLIEKFNKLDGNKYDELEKQQLALLLALISSTEKRVVNEIIGEIEKEKQRLKDIPFNSTYNLEIEDKIEEIEIIKNLIKSKYE